MLGTHNDEELVKMYDGEGFYHHAWTWKKMREGLLGQGFAEQKQLEHFVRNNIGEFTFEEAFAKTGRHINVTVSPVQAHKARLMNELTSPYLLVWSAALASCAVPILFPAVTLTAKNYQGEYHPYMPAKQWVDGSVRSDLPRQRLARLFNVNYFIASQVNPHIVPFMQTDKERLEKGKLVSWPKKVARAQLQMVGMGVFDFMRERTQIETIRQLMDHGYGIIGQRYYGDVTIVAKYTWRHYACMLQNPTDDMLRWFRIQGERITWPKISMIQTHARIGQTLDQCIQSLSKQQQSIEEQRRANVIHLQTAKRHTAQIG
jgi:NTE family protein